LRRKKKKLARIAANINRKNGLEDQLKLVSCGLSSSYPVDVVDLDHVADAIRDSIDRYGKILYKKKKNDLLRLAAELESDLSILETLTRKNKRAWKRIEGGCTEELDWAALGYTIHNLYNLLKSYFLRIAKFFENSLDPLSWHGDLVQQSRERTISAFNQAHRAFIMKVKKIAEQVEE
jgi:hypothetical protein